MIPTVFASTACSIAFVLGVRFDIRRRNLSLLNSAGWTVLSVLDVASTAITITVATALLIASPYVSVASGSPISPASAGALSCVALLLFLWSEARHQVQLQRPAGIVFGEWGILVGVYCLIASYIATPGILLPALYDSHSFHVASLVPMLAGGAIIAVVLPPFVKGREEHRILDRIAAQGEFIQSEYVAPTPECPFPKRWQMVDAQSAEIEVLGFLKSLVVTTKPELIVETGTFIGHSAIKMGEGLKANGFGRLITIEYDAAVFRKAKDNIDASGLGKWIEYRNASSLEADIQGPIDILFSDSDVNIRESEIRRFLPQIKARGLVLVHDASSSFKVVREAVLSLEKEGLLSVVLLSTPRGLVIAQKREGRT